MRSLYEALTYKPNELSFGTSGLRALVTDMTDLECYINVAGFIKFLEVNEQLQKTTTIYVAGDLRDSTPRIIQVVHKAVSDCGYKTVSSGKIPTPAMAYYAQTQQSPCIMVTGSHIPADRNGIKFYKIAGEVMKQDEQGIQEAVAGVRQRLYEQDTNESIFGKTGRLKQVAESQLTPKADAKNRYQQRYLSFFAKDFLAGKKIVVYQHSAVGRDMLVDLLEQFGATVISVGRSDEFVPIDSENVKPKDQAYFRKLAKDNTGLFAVVSTDGDSDRPFVIDETGRFHRGDVLGAVVALWLKADSTAYPVTRSDAVDEVLSADNVAFVHTKIGSPYVVEAMQAAKRKGAKTVVGWEVNGGVLLGTDIKKDGKTLEALATRDAFLPILVVLAAATEEGLCVSEIFAKLPERFTNAGLLDNFPSDVSKAIVQRYSGDFAIACSELSRYFTTENGFSKITAIDTLDGVRITFDNGEIAHMRPSGNAPQLRIYSAATTQARADEIVAVALREPDGILRCLEKAQT